MNKSFQFSSRIYGYLGNTEISTYHPLSSMPSIRVEGQGKQLKWR